MKSYKLVLDLSATLYAFGLTLSSRTATATLIFGGSSRLVISWRDPLALPESPTASLSASPNTIEEGQSTFASNATKAEIDGIGNMRANGSQQASPTDSTTYTLTVQRTGGTQMATARVTVVAPPPSPPPEPCSPIEEELFYQNVKDIYFDYDKADIRADQQGALQVDINFLNQHPNTHFVVEGHSDECGSTEYNLPLDDNRASAVKKALTPRGPRDNVKTMNYGKEKPFCAESNEWSWSQNRREQFVYQK
jgi:peptidoglycan-associated lipoprotein